MKKDYFEKKSNNLKQDTTSLNKKSQLLSLIRFIVFCLFAGCLILGFYDGKVGFVFAGIVFLIIFLIIITLHNKLEWELDFKKSTLQILDSYLKRFENSWQDFENTGEQFKDNDSYLIKDLDIIGQNSLFQYIVLAKSNRGQNKLFNELIDNTKISNNQKAIYELAEKKDFHLELSTLINMYDNKKSDLFLNDNNYLDNTMSKLYFFLTKVYTPLVVLLLLASLSGLIPMYFGIICLVVNAIIILLRFSYNKDFLANIHTHNNNLPTILKVIEKIETATFEDFELKKQQDILKSENTIASSALKQLVRLKERLESQSNAIVYFLAEIILLWDYQNVVTFNKWKQTTGKSANRFLEVYYNFEMLLSLGVIQQTKEISSLPDLKISARPYLKIEQLYHPLLNEKNVVSNNFSCENQTTIITGSNMSGKTTFIRSIGINLVLAYAGASVCAQSFSASLMRLFTSIRVEDNLNDGISTFYAEIKRIKTMVDFEKDKEPMLCLIDEIFKGTNSEDRIYGAKKAIDNLTKPYSITFVTTHDAQLTELAFVKNYHFSEYYNNDEIHFDYKIKEGVSQTRNAKYLLKMAGIIDE